MSGIDCTKCGAHVTVPGLNWCPICRAPMKPLPSRTNASAASEQPALTIHAKIAPEVAKTARSRKLTGEEWVAVICVPAIAIFLIMIVYRIVVPSESKKHDNAVMEALAVCQRAIASTAEYGGADTPPYTQNYGKGDDFYFAWPKGSFEFTNGFGAKVKMSASCNGKVSTGEITSLTVNGKDFR